MPEASQLNELNPFSDELAELRDELNELLREYNDYHRDAEGIAGLNVVMGDNGFSVEDRIESVSANTTLDTTHRYVMVTSGAGGVTITLPAAADSTGVVYTIKKIDAGAGAVTIDGNASETIDDVTTKALSSQYDFATIVCDGTEWWIISQ